MLKPFALVVLVQLIGWPGVPGSLNRTEQVQEPLAFCGQGGLPAVKALGVTVQGVAAKVNRPLKTSVVPIMSRQANDVISQRTVRDM